MLVYQRVDVKYDVMLFEIPACAVVPHLKKGDTWASNQRFTFFSNMFYVLSCFMWSILSYMWVIVGAYVGKLVNIYVYIPPVHSPIHPPKCMNP